MGTFLFSKIIASHPRICFLLFPLRFYANLNSRPSPKNVSAAYSEKCVYLFKSGIKKDKLEKVDDYVSNNQRLMSDRSA